MQNVNLKIINNKKKLQFAEKNAEKKNVGKLLNLQTCFFKRGRKSKTSLKENGVVSFDAKKNANIFVGFS